MTALHFSDLKSQVFACIVQLCLANPGFYFILHTLLTGLLTKPPSLCQLKAGLFEAFICTFTMAMTCNNRTFLHQIQ